MLLAATMFDGVRTKDPKAISMTARSIYQNLSGLYLIRAVVSVLRSISKTTNSWLQLERNLEPMLFLYIGVFR